MPSPSGSHAGSTLAVVIPCLNEAPAIKAVVEEYRAVLPHARILVVDNASTDGTAEVARAAGAEVLSAPIRGKARAMLVAFEHVQDDLLLMVDGDGSYPAGGAVALLESFQRAPADFVSGIRSPELAAGQAGQATFRPLHQFGTRVFERFLWWSFRYRTRDLFSGLRLMTRKFYKNVPILSRGFELEIELTIQAVDKGFSLHEIPVPFRERADGTASKLDTVRDGWRILRALFVLLRDYRPLFFFSRASACILALGLMAGFLPVYEYFQTSLVGRFPLAILAASLVSLAVLLGVAGLILEGNLRHHRESYQVKLRNFSTPAERPRAAARATDE
ncbi:MAG: glycosyltransferase [Verrucomicrobia bacterium]|nr:glycosyltransferase [Verrucomicrobiota bacterium]